jgi:hypothetical protein
MKRAIVKYMIKNDEKYYFIKREVEESRIFLVE